ncbi:calcium-binding protein [Hellea sp.]|nr:calcium-binding protein [Hellea sp.]
MKLLTDTLNILTDTLDKDLSLSGFINSSVTSFSALPVLAPSFSSNSSNTEAYQESVPILSDNAANQTTNGPDINGTAGDDNLTGTAEGDEINGLAGNDILTGLGGDDILNGGGDADLLRGGEGADELNGGDGFDSADYRLATSGVRFNVDTGGTFGEANGDTFSGIERYFLSDFNDIVTGSDTNEFFFGEGGNDTINGGGGIDRIDGGDGNDILRGQDGNDLIFGSAGGDQINGGAGFDVVSYENSASRVELSLATGGTLGDAAGDTYFGIEVVRGSDFDDTLTGNNSSNELRGGDGDDILNGGGGNDRLFGGEGADTFNGGAGFDIAVYTDSTQSVAVDLGFGGFSNTGTNTPSDSDGDTYSSVEWVFGSDFDDFIVGDNASNRLEGRDGEDQIFGQGGNDRILGGDGGDTIFGGDGVDTIFGQGGNDSLNGGNGNDFFFGSEGGDSIRGGSGFDTVSYLASTSGVTVSLSGGGTAGDAAGDSYLSIERVFGTSFDDSITGSDVNDVLLGNGGSDYLTGGAGQDSLLGGAGIDSFGYDTTSDGTDFITDFFGGETIFILGGDAAFDTFAELQAAATDFAGNVRFDFGGGNMLTVVGRNIADLDANDFDFSGTAPSAPPPQNQSASAPEPLDDAAMVADFDAMDYGMIA